MRNVINDDIFNWFNCIDDGHYSYVASMPDYSEFPNYKIEEWKDIEPFEITGEVRNIYNI